MRKQFYVILLILCFGCGLYACGKGTQSDSNDETPSGPSTSPDSTAETTDAPSEAVGEPTAYEKLFADGPLCVQDENELWGYIDISGDYVIEPQFLNASSFVNGLAAVQDAGSGLYGYIDTSGTYKIQPQFDLAHDFSDDLAVVEQDGLCGYVDTSGMIAIPIIFAEAYNFMDDTAVVKGSGSYDNGGSYDRGGGFSGGYAHIDRSGQYLDYPLYDDAFSFNKGVAFVGQSVSGYWLIDKDYNILADGVRYTMNGYRKGADELNRKFMLWPSDLCCVNDVRYDRWCFINTSGEVVLPQSGNPEDYYVKANDFSEGYAAVQDPASELWGYIDLDGNWAIPPQYGYARSFSSGYAVASDSVSGLDGYIDTNGDWVIAPQYASVNGQVFNDRAVVSVITLQDGLSTVQYIIDTSGNIIAEFGKEIQFPTILNNIFPVSCTIDPETYERIWGYMNIDGNMVTDFIFDEAERFASDCSYAKVQYNGLWGIIDQDGNWLIPAKFKSMR